MNRILILILSTLLFCLLQFGGAISALSDKALDVLFLLRGPVSPSQDIVIIGIDEESLDALGSWPFARKHHANLLKKLSKARVIGFDILFVETGEYDELLSATIKKSPPVILATAHDYQGHILNPVPSLSGYSGIGHIEVILSRDGIVRKAKSIQKERQSSLLPFSAAILKVAGDNKTSSTLHTPILINHYGPELTFLYLSYIDVLQGLISEDFFQDRFVLIGVQALGIGDSHITPFSRQFPTPGVEIQASILNNLIDTSMMKTLQPLSWLLVSLIGLLPLFVWPGLGLRWNMIVNSSFTVLLFLSSFILFHFSFFLTPVPAMLFLGLNFGVYLFMERFLTAKEILNEIKRLDRHLETRLKRLYTNVPSHFSNQSSTPATADNLEKHLAHLRAGVKVLSLQHHFIERILREELLPLILWDKQSGIVTIANTSFNRFCDTHISCNGSLPNFRLFTDIIERNRTRNHNSAQNISTLLKNKTCVDPIDICLTKQGLKKYYRINIQAFDIPDIPFSGVMAILTDVTEIKELEILKGKIVAIASHELKLPLTVIRGYGEMLSTMLKDTEKQYIEEICSQTERLNRLIENFLDTARLEQKHQGLRKLPLNFLELIKEAKGVVSILAENKSIELLSQLPFRASPLIGDYSLLLQAVINLLDNAIKYSPANTQISIKLIEDIDTLTLCISDQGPGVPTESQKKIFDTFNRGQQTGTIEGFGLGLSFVQQAIWAHGGKVWLDTSTDRGARFCFTLNKTADTA